MDGNEALKDINLYNYIKDNKQYTNKWVTKKTKNQYVQKVLANASKKKTNNKGEPDLIYLNEKRKFLILLEDKDSIKRHESEKRNKAEDYAVDGALHYMKFFLPKEIEKRHPELSNYFSDFIVVGIAVSGDIEDEYNHKISTFIINRDKIEELDYSEILDESDYISYYENIDLEAITKEISESSKRINNLLRSIDSQERPILLSALMICLFENEENEFTREYKRWSTRFIVDNIEGTVQKVLRLEGISDEKIQVLINKLSFLKNDYDLNNTEVIKDILNTLKEKIIPLFSKKNNYDIIGKFYEEFLRFAGVSNVKKGIVLTPHHVTDFFTKVIDLKDNDVIFDPCCGTGAFLISGMNKIVSLIEESDLEEEVKEKKIKNIKHKQLVGFEKHPTMYSLSISNMLFRGDGKSQIHYVDFFSPEADEILEKLKKSDYAPTIGFINPPYGGRDNKAKPTKKEIQFLVKMLDNVSRYGIMIAPISTYFKDEDIRKSILKKHTLKYVINMPGELFQPNASTHTAIAVFETNKPHRNKEVVFYDLVDDGLVLSKNRGRTDAYNRWEGICERVIKELNDPAYANGITILRKKLYVADEWIIQAHAKTDYSKLNNNSFLKAIKKYLIFSTKKELDLLDKDIDEISLLEILNENVVNGAGITKEKE